MRFARFAGRTAHRILTRLADNDRTDAVVAALNREWAVVNARRESRWRELDVDSSARRVAVMFQERSRS